ncbi:MAG TPA: T9SS type A sorting domain-containing protein [Rubricoccaceae bacterium]|jgi:hypothetical protein
MSVRLSRLLLLSLFLLPAVSQAQPLLQDNFRGSPGSALTANGWTAIATGATPVLSVTANNLTFPNYPSVSGNAAGIGPSGQDVNRSFTSQTSGTVYAAFLVNVSAAQTGDYFFGLERLLGGSSYVGRVYARSAAGGVQFGLSRSSTNTTVLPVYTTTEYALNTTYLLVVEYQIVAGASNDTVSLNVISAGEDYSAEPATPTVTDPTVAADLAGIGTVALRQGTTGQAPALTLDGLRVATTWAEAVQPAQRVQDGAGYRLLGAPVQGVTVGTLAGINLVQGVEGQYPSAGDNLFTGYTGSGTQDGYVPATSVADALTPGYGFFWYLFDQSITPGPTEGGGGTSVSYPVPERLLATSGPVNTADVVAPFATNADGFYPIANPFSQALAATGITRSAGGGTFSNILQAYDPTTGYVTIDRTTSTALSVWQGVFAEVQGATAPTFTFAAASRTDATPVLVSRDAATTGLALALDGATAAGATHDEAAQVRFTDAASAGWDADDASKLTPPTAAHALIAPVGTRDGVARRQAVLSRPTGDLADVTLAFMATTAGTFTLTAEATGLSAEATVRDLATGQTARLADGYTFTSDTTDWTERFVVSFGRTTAGEGTAAAVTTLSAPAPNPATGQARLTLRLAAPEHVTATVVDALGRTVATLYDAEAAAGADLALGVDASRLAPGVYVVRVQGATFTESRRLTVVR